MTNIAIKNGLSLSQEDKSLIKKSKKVSLVKTEKDNEPEIKKYRQSTLECFVKDKDSKKVKNTVDKENVKNFKSKLCKNKDKQKQDLFLEEIKPSPFIVPEDLTKEIFVQALEIIEFAHNLSFVFCPTEFEKIHKKEIYLDFMKCLKQQNCHNFHILYQILKIFILTAIELENVNKIDSKTKPILKYAHTWARIIEYLSYETLPEFIKIFINIVSFSIGQTDRSIYRYRYLGDFYTFSTKDKLKIFEILLSDIITHISFSKILEQIVDAQKAYKVKISNSTAAKDMTMSNLSATELNQSRVLRNSKLSNEDLKCFQYLECDSVNDISCLIERFSILEGCFRNLPISLEDKTYIWKFETISFILIENKTSNSLQFYDDSHLPSIRALSFNEKQEQDTLKNLISILENKSKYSLIKFENEDIVSIVEETKKIICKIIQLSITNNKSYDYLKQKLIILNKNSAFELRPWAFLFSEFIYRTFETLKRLYGFDIPVSPVRSGKSLSTYTKKVTSWSGLCLSALMVESAFESIPYIKNKLMRVTFASSDGEDDRDENGGSAENSKKMVECSQCRKSFETSDKFQHKLLIFEWYCRSCRYERRHVGAKTSVTKNNISKTRISSTQVSSGKNVEDSLARRKSSDKVAEESITRRRSRRISRPILSSSSSSEDSS